jgi:two-component system, response regulator PdtaR
VVEFLSTENPKPEPGPPVILVVEDEVLIRMMLAEEFRGAGYAVLEAANADEALAVMAASPDIALLFTDVRMPGSMDGLALVQWVRANRPDVKVVVSSADSAHLLAPPTWDASMRKPFDIAALLRGVEELLGERGAPGVGDVPDAAGEPA